uniref:Uncharacterized protein n=1 Tax=Plectus sambesii TaxID=2011161 RepID=A0A914VA15_9BILA
LEVNSKTSHSDLLETHNALTAIYTAVSALGCKDIEKPKALKAPVVNNK